MMPAVMAITAMLAVALLALWRGLRVHDARGTAVPYYAVSLFCTGCAFGGMLAAFIILFTGGRAHG